MADALTPKQQYEKRRAEIKEARARAQFRSDHREDETETITLLFERFVTAAERIADALEATGPNTQTEQERP